MAIVRYSDAAAAAMLDGPGLIPYINAGTGNATIKFYTGTVPATGDTALGSQTLLATLTCADPVEAGAAASRTVTFDTITGANAVANGTSTFAIIENPDVDRVAVVDVGNTSSTATIKLTSTAFVSGQPAGLTALTVSIPVTLTS
jgi:hypothetical protein